MIYYWFYRALMRFAHRYDWHYAPIIGPLEDGSTQLWCKWCGFNEVIRPQTTYVITADLRAALDKATAGVETLL